MSLLKQREHGQEHPYWSAGPFKIRLPFIHYRWEWAETVQALILFVVNLAMIPLLQKYLGLPYDIAMTYVMVCGFGIMLPALLGIPFIPGWITPAIPVVLMFLGNFEPGPEAIRALVGLQLIVTLIFFVFGITGWGRKLVDVIPNSIKAGILIGAGIAAITGEISTGGRAATTPISVALGFIIIAYMLFSESFQETIRSNRWARRIVNYGMVPGMIIAMFIGWGVGEYKLPNVEMGINAPNFSGLIDYLPFTLGWPSLEMLWMAVPTAIIAYIIAFGDIIVGQKLIERVDNERKDELIKLDIDRVHFITAIRNLLHSFFAPYPGLSGPLFTGAMVTITERYRQGRKAMDSIYSGAGTLWIAGFIALFMLPLVTFFKPVLPVALSLTLLITGYLCIAVGSEQVKNNTTSMGVAGTMGVILAVHGAAYGLIAGFVMYMLLERKKDRAKQVETKPEEVVEADS